MEHHSSRRHHHHHSGTTYDAGSNRSHHHSSSDHEHSRHHSSSSSRKWRIGGSGPQKTAEVGAFFCGAFGIVAIAIHIVLGIISANNSDMSTFYANLTALAFAAGGFVCGFYGEIVLMRYPSRRLRLKLFFGMLITLTALAIGSVRIYQHYRLPELQVRRLDPVPDTEKILTGETVTPAPEAAATEVTPEPAHNVSPKPAQVVSPEPAQVMDEPKPTTFVDEQKSWYGEHGDEVHDEAVAIFSACPAWTEDAKMIAPLVTKPVAYATLNLLNHSDQPVLFRINNVTAIRKDGGVIRCLPILELLRSDVPEARILIEKIVAIGEQGSLPPQKMATKLPVAFPVGLNWAEISEVNVELNGKPVKILGKLLTEREKKELSNQ